MLELAQDVLAGEEAWVVGGAVRDELLGRELVDLDIAVRDPRKAARAFAKRAGGAPFALSERHGAWRVVLENGHTVDFTPLPGSIEDDLATRDFTINAIARPLAGGEPVDPFGGRDDLEAHLLRAVGESVFRDDPLRLLRAVRLEDELELRLDEETERLVQRDAELVGKPAGERILAELQRLSAGGYRRLDGLGLLAPLGGRIDDRLDRWDSPGYRLVAVFGDELRRFPVSNGLRRFAAALLRAEPPEPDARAIHRFRRATEPWALEALAFAGASELAPAIEEARANDPAEPLLRGDELDLPPGPEIGRLLAEIEEERAAGTIATREEALDYARRHAERFAKTAERVAALQDARAAELEQKVLRFVDPKGDERALDSGSGPGALAFALAPHVREVVALDLVPELLEQGRRRAENFPNVSFVEGDATSLPFELGAFDLAGTLRTLHHVARPELVVAELVRVTRPGGRVLVIDQIAPIDPLAASELNAFERARDPSTSRVLAEVDLRGLFESNGLVLVRSEQERESRDIDAYLELAGCEGEERRRAESLAPRGYTAELGWYLLERR